MIAYVLAAVLAVPAPTVVSVTLGSAPVRPGGAVATVTTATAARRTCLGDVWLTLGAGRRAALPGDCVAPRLVAGRIDGWDAIRRRNGGHVGALAVALRREGRCVAAESGWALLGAADEDGDVVTDVTACDVVLRDTPAPDGATIDVVVDDARHLGLVTVFPGSGLLTGTPRRDGFLTLADVTRLLAPVGVGVKPRVVPGSLSDLDDLRAFATAQRKWNGLWVAGLVTFPLLLLIALGLRRGRGSRPLRWLGVLVATYPTAGFLVGIVPWWRWGPLALLAAMLALALAGLGTEVGVAAASAAVFAVDLLTGTHLQQNALASYSPIAGGRFYGLGNLAFGVFAASVVVVCGVLAMRYGCRAWIAGLVALGVLDGGPGTDFGGVVAVVAAGAAAYTRRLRAIVLAAVIGLGLALGVAYADSTRSAPTHLGRFVKDGDLGDTVARKAHAAIHSVTGTWYPLLVVGCAVAAYLMVRRRTELKDTAIVLAVLLTVGSLVNDSGLAVAGAGLAVATPLLVSYWSRT